MTLKSKILDWAGMTIRCKNLIVGADKGNTTNDVDTSAKLQGGSFVLTFPTGAATAAGTGSSSAGVSTGGVASKVLQCSVNGTTYYIGLFSSNA